MSTERVTGQREQLRRRKLGYGCIAAAALVYSTTEVSIKSVSDVFSTMQITVLRVLIGGLFLLPFALRELRRRKVRLDGRDLRYFLCMGFICVALQIVFLQLSINAMDASATAAIYSGNPIFATVFAYFILKEPLLKRNLAALGLEIVGILFILNPLHIQISLSGFLFAILSTLTFALYGTFSRISVPRYGSVAMACLVLLTGGAELLAVTLLGEIPAVASVFDRVGLGIFSRVDFTAGYTVKSTLILAYICLVVTVGGYLLLAKAVECTSATEASFIYLFKPIIAAAFSAALLHETISLNRIIGIGFFTAASVTAILPVFLEMRRSEREGGRP